MLLRPVEELMLLLRLPENKSVWKDFEKILSTLPRTDKTKQVEYVMSRLLGRMYLPSGDKNYFLQRIDALDYSSLDYDQMMDVISYLKMIECTELKKDAYDFTEKKAILSIDGQEENGYSTGYLGCELLESLKRNKVQVPGNEYEQYRILFRELVMLQYLFYYRHLLPTDPVYDHRKAGDEMYLAYYNEWDFKMEFFSQKKSRVSYLSQFWATGMIEELKSRLLSVGNDI